MGGRHGTAVPSGAARDAAWIAWCAATSPSRRTVSNASWHPQPNPACKRNAPPSVAKSSRTSHAAMAGAMARSAGGRAAAANNCVMPW